MAKEVPSSKQKIREELDKIKEQMPQAAAPQAKAEVIDADAIMAKATGAKKKPRYLKLFPIFDRKTSLYSLF